MNTELNVEVPRRICVIVVGPHRSGTSVLARIIATLGCKSPRNLMEGAYGNEDGHWESSLISAFNDELLDAFGARWDACFPLQHNWQDNVLIPHFRSRAAQLIDEEFGDAPLFVLKDPRFCRIPQFWISVLQEKGIEVALVLPYRHPQEIADSLANRDATPHWYGQLLWLRNILDAEAGTRDNRRLFTSYDRLCRDWRTTIDAIGNTFGFDFPRSSPITSKEIDKFLRAPAKGNAMSSVPPGRPAADDILSWLAECAEVFSNWAENGERRDDCARLDVIRARFDRIVIELGGLLTPAENAGTVGEGARRQEELLQQMNVMENQVVTLKADLDSSRTELDALPRSAVDDTRGEELEAQLDAARRELASRQEKLVAVQTRCTLLLNDLESLRDLNTGLIGQASGLHRDIAERDLRLGQREAETRLEAARRAEAEKAVLQMQAELSKRLIELERLTRQIDDLEAKIAFNESRLRQRDEEIDQYRSQIEALEAGRVDAEALRNNLAESEGWVFRLAGERAELEGQVRQLTRAMAASDRRVRELARLLEQQRDKVDQARAEGKRNQEQLLRELQIVERLAAAKLKETIAAKDEELHRLHLRAESAEARQHSLDASMQERFAEIAKLTEELLAKDRKISQLGEDLIRNRNRADQAEAAGLEASGKLRERFEELAKLTGHVMALEQKSADIGWMRELHITLARRPFWWFIMPEGWRRKREHAMLRRAGLFDAAVYLERYPDVARDGMDPVRHYVLHGSTEGRDRSLG